jgi:hypothetical protein
MADDSTGGMQFSTFPSYDQIKNQIIIQKAIAENAVAEYYEKETDVRQRTARTSLIKLGLALTDYLYLIKDEENKQYFCYFLANPDQFDKMNELGAVLAIQKDIIYSLGISQIEQAKLPAWETYKELE